MATLKDVAKASGLTVGTVSRVLNNRGYISDKTREKVYRVMKELDYQPNEMARSLSKQKNNIIGVKETLQEAEETKEKREEQCIEMCKSGRVAGVVLCSGSFETEKFRGLDFPLITLERSMDEGTSGVECDNYQGGTLATQHLIDKGCHKLMYIGGMSAGEDIHMPADFREVAFRDTCAKTKTENVVIVTEKQMFDSMEYYEFIREKLIEHPDVDGVFASSDVIGAYVLQACYDLNIEVPGRLKIVGFDDVNIAQFTSPGLTTIHQPVEQMAEQAISAIVQIDAGKVVPTKTVFPVTLVERGPT